MYCYIIILVTIHTYCNCTSTICLVTYQEIIFIWKFMNVWMFTSITVGLKIIQYNSCNFTQQFFTVHNA